jgi:hypothetical protein
MLDHVTGGAFSAATAGERASRVREWLQNNPAAEVLSDVFKELSVKDKGAAKLVRERLDELKRTKMQESIATEWANKAQQLLSATKLNIADALAWQRDAAKAGAPLSKEPLLALKVQLSDRVRTIEDLQHQVQVQREAAVLLAQRIEVLSTKPWQDAEAAWETLRTDISHWQQQADTLVLHAGWVSVDAKFPPLLEASKAQLLVVWDAFEAALKQTVAAAQDASAPLPPVPVWAEALRQARGVAPESAVKAAKPKIDPEVRAKAQGLVRQALDVLKKEMDLGHSKASAGAANTLRQALKETSKLIDGKLENLAHAALAAAGELEGWQRWRADQLREELVSKAEALLKRPEAVGGRKLQENLRQLREQWKLTDQGGVPNHVLWKRFDDACNEAYKSVEVWLEKVKAESAEHRAQRLALIEEVKAWADANRQARDNDWKGFHRVLQQFAERWRTAGHVSEKMFAELQPLWKSAYDYAAAPLETLQKQSITLREAMIEEAKSLGEATVLRLDAVKALQQRWQAQVHAVPIDRRLEQKLWDTFRKPIDAAFERKSQERQKAEQALSARDKQVMDAAKAVETAIAAAEVHAIKTAITNLERIVQGQDEAAQSAATAAEPLSLTDNTTSEAAEQKPVAVAKPVIAVRGDDRPGMKKEAVPVTDRFAKRTDKRPDKRTEQKEVPRAAAIVALPPRLGDVAFRAQRDAFESAQAALRKLASQAHGEALTQLLTAWEERNGTKVPTVNELGSQVNAAVRTAWIQGLSNAVASAEETAQSALLRLEIAADIPTPAAFLDARRAMQLQLLTQRNSPPPIQTWAQDVGKVLASSYAAESAKRLQNVLKVLLKR